MRPRLAVPAAAVLAVGGAIAAVALLRGEDRPRAPAVVPQAPWRGDGVVHAVAEAPSRAEEWLDLESGALRAEQSAGAGPAAVSLRAGLRVARWSGATPSLVDVYEAADADDPALQAGVLLAGHGALRAGTGRIVGGGEVAGHETWRVRLLPGPLEGTELEDARITYDVDRRTFLLRAATYELDGRRHVYALRHEPLDRSALPAGFFRFPPAAETRRRIRLAELGAAVPFPVLTAGGDVAGRAGSALLFVESGRVVLEYGAPRDAVLQLRQWSGARTGELSPGLERRPRRTVTIAGVPADVRLVREAPGQTRFGLVRGDLVVEGWARLSERETLALLRTLRLA